MGDGSVAEGEAEEPLFHSTSTSDLCAPVLLYAVAMRKTLPRGSPVWRESLQGRSLPGRVQSLLSTQLGEQRLAL